MSDTNPEPAFLALSRAKEADGRIWSQQSGVARWRSERAAAVRDAVDAGLPVEQVAIYLRVRTQDVERMVDKARSA